MDRGREGKYVPLYVPVTIASVRVVRRVGCMDNKSPRRIAPASPPSLHVEGPDGDLRLFIVERRLPGMTKGGLAMLQNALILATARFALPEKDLRYLWSIFIPGQDRFLSLFAAVNLELVRAANEASLVPFIQIENAYYLSDPFSGAGV